MKLKKDFKYALVVPTSMGVRISPQNGQPVQSSNLYFMQATSAETNVASISSYLGLPVKVLTTFVKDSPIAQFIKSDLRARGMEFEGREVEQGGPWGYRHQFNIADSGYGARGPRVLNDRAGEVGRTLSLDDFDLERLFGTDGVCVLHLSGLICALSPETGKFCLELAKTAKKDGNVELITTADKTGRKAYRRSVTLLMQKKQKNTAPPFRLILIIARPFGKTERRSFMIYLLKYALFRTYL